MKIMEHEDRSMSITEQASIWMVQLTSGDATADEWHKFEAWLAEDLRHESEYHRVERIWEGLAGSDDSFEDLLVDPKNLDTASAFTSEAPTFEKQGPFPIQRALNCSQPTSKANRWIAFSLVASVIFAVTLVINRQWLKNQGFLGADMYRTGLAQVQEFSLPDGSVVTLGASSSMTVHFQHSERNVELASGQAFFQVVKNTARPFYVRAGETQVKVVGTQFDVRHGREVKVAVLKGVVEVAQLPPSVQQAAGREATIVKRLIAGQVVETQNFELLDVETVPEAHPGAWRDGRLVYINESLREVIGDANRYYDKTIVLENDELGDLKVTASFNVDQIDQMIITLSAALNLNVRSFGSKKIMLYRQSM
jgi:transmembrane sensor